MAEPADLPKKYWLKVNNQTVVRFSQPLNPGFVFWLKRRYHVRVHSEGGERVSITRPEPFSQEELSDLYSELEYRQQIVSKNIATTTAKWRLGASLPTVGLRELVGCDCETVR